MTLYASVLFGIQRARLQLAASSSNVARSSVEGAPPLVPQGRRLGFQGDSVELGAECVRMGLAQVQQGASLKVLETALELDKTSIDTFA